MGLQPGVTDFFVVTETNWTKIKGKILGKEEVFQSLK